MSKQQMIKNVYRHYRLRGFRASSAIALARILIEQLTKE